MRERLGILFVADGRSPIALNWIRQMIRRGHIVHLVSTFPCQPLPGLASFAFIPTAFSGMKKAADAGAGAKKRGMWGAAAIRLRTRLRQFLGPLTLSGAAQSLRGTIAACQPDLVHAMRIPYEGMVAALAAPPVPLMVSVWGNDFTLHAPATPLMSRRTRATLRRADALHADCERDIRLGRAWGFPSERPVLVAPGGGGVQLDIFYPPVEDRPDTPVVINPRGFRAYVRNDTFFQAIPLVLEKIPQARFVCTGMQGQARAEGWAREAGFAEQVELLPQQPREGMADLFRLAQVLVSPSTHDGTPNTLLEGMACGCFPVVGDLESLREWIIPGVNGLFVDPTDPIALAAAITTALQTARLRREAAVYNGRLVAERAEHESVMLRVEAFYRSLV